MTQGGDVTFGGPQRARGLYLSVSRARGGRGGQWPAEEDTLFCGVASPAEHWVLGIQRVIS